MALFQRLSPEEKAEKKRLKEEAERRAREASEKEQQERLRQIQEQREAEEKRKAEEAFRKTAAGKARTAKEAGRTIFQYIEVLTETTAHVVPMIGAYTSDEEGEMGLQSALGKKGRTLEPAIEQIESEGWNLVNAGYVFQPTTSESRDKFLASGQQEAIGGRVLGVYTFRLAP